MTETPIQIRKPSAVHAIRKLAEKSGQPITDAVEAAVTSELARREAVDEAEYRRRMEAIRDAVQRFNDLPVVGPLLTDDDLYDEDGLPK